MKVTYIYHSCFVVELSSVIFIFDYFKGRLPELAKDKEIYVFSSHKHHDHFSLEIFRMMEEYYDVTYILSNDIKLSDKYLSKYNFDPSLKGRIVFVQKNKKYILGEGEHKICVETLTSTDQGVAFIIEAEEKTVYHAGDLNWWTWIGESESEFKEMTRRYQEEIRKIANRNFDLAFVVLDPRQEERYWWGLDYFAKNTKARRIIPMHCWEKYKIMQSLLLESAVIEYKDNIICYEREGETITL